MHPGEDKPGWDDRRPRLMSQRVLHGAVVPGAPGPAPGGGLGRGPARGSRGRRARRRGRRACRTPPPGDRHHPDAGPGPARPRCVPPRRPAVEGFKVPRSPSTPDHAQVVPGTRRYGGSSADRPRPLCAGPPARADSSDRPDLSTTTGLAARGGGRALAAWANATGVTDGLKEQRHGPRVRVPDQVVRGHVPGRRPWPSLPRVTQVGEPDSRSIVAKSSIALAAIPLLANTRATGPGPAAGSPGESR